MATIAFTTAFAVPAAVTGLVIVDDPDTSIVRLSWDSSPIAVSLFDRYEVEYQSGDSVWARADAGDLTVQANPSFEHLAAPTGVLVRYRVRVGIGAAGFESLPLEGEVTQPSAWAFVDEEESSLSEGGLYIQPGASQSEGWPIAFFQPLGRSFPVAAEEPRPSDRLGRVLSLSIFIPRSRLDIAEKLFIWQRRSSVLVKDPDGWVGRCKLSDWSKSYQQAGHRSGSLTATQVG